MRKGSANLYKSDKIDKINPGNYCKSCILFYHFSNIKNHRVRYCWFMAILGVP